ncbi:hypothetical protein NHF48_000855 [Sphingomonas sp. H160509]|nr:hypothetical protein [Sphingomonas sp. H160509]MDD1449807.1 hypothetical protein [Sphingomonas sp. H160509]
MTLELRQRLEAGETAPEIAKAMNRSISAVQTKMFRLNVLAQ